MTNKSISAYSVSVVYRPVSNVRFILNIERSKVGLLSRKCTSELHLHNDHSPLVSQFPIFWGLISGLLCVVELENLLKPGNPPAVLNKCRAKTCQNESWTVCWMTACCQLSAAYNRVTLKIH